MAVSVTNATSGQPGPVTYVGAATKALLFNDMNITRPDFNPELYDRYGEDGSYGMLTMEMNSAYGGAFRSIIEKTTSGTQNFEHFEKSRPLASGTVNADVTGATAGTSITVTLGTGSYYSSGTESAFRTKEYGFIGTTGVKFQIGTVNRTTANAFTVVLKPVNTTEKLASAGQVSTLLATDLLCLIGNQAAGEASTSMDPQSTFIYKISNSTSIIRDDYTITDVAAMESTIINFKGGSNKYYEFATTELNKRFMYYIENLCIEGINVTNLGTGYSGTTGVIPTVTASAPLVTYTKTSMLKTDLLSLATVWEYNGGPSEYHILQETKQQDDVDSLLFGLYNNGAIRYASVGGEERLSVMYGFKSWQAKNKTMHFYNYKNFNLATTYGKLPALTGFRDYAGLCIPQGVKPDAKSGVLMPNMQWVYQEYKPGVRWLTYESGGLADENKTTTLQKQLTQAVTVGQRTISPQQFAMFTGT